jgi:hypothetical protein
VYAGDIEPSEEAKMNIYQRDISTITGETDEQKILKIEQAMRAEVRTFDAMTMAQFVRLAKRAHRTVQEMERKK